MLNDHEIPIKANRVLNIIFLALVLILIRTWYLGVVQHDSYLQIARKPQVRSVIEEVERGTIRDRFNIPLAINKMQYNAAILYSQIRQIPSVTWKKDPNGKKYKEFTRKEHILALSEKLASILEMDATVIEDQIHCRASLFPQTPFVIKENIGEKQYYKLRMLEKDFLGIHTQKSTKRVYPQGKIACDVLGYMGAIHQKQYQKIANEIKELQTYISLREAGEFPFLPLGFSTPMQVKERLTELQEKAYTINAFVGKAGVEAAFDEELRGFYGKKNFEVDVKGNFLRELPGSRKMIAGQRILLSISSELQEYAETLLANYDAPLKKGDESHLPWIKGGAIVAMLPSTGEIVTLASYPRFDPNHFSPSQDFTQKKAKQQELLQWLENESYLAEIWNGKRPLSKEHYKFSKNAFEEITQPLSWSYYLQTIINPASSIRKAIDSVSNIKAAFLIQKELKKLLSFSEQDSVSALIDTLFANQSQSSLKTTPSQKEGIAKKLEENFENAFECRSYVQNILQPISHNDDKLLFLDLCRLVVDIDKFSPSLLEAVGNQSISDYRFLCQTIFPLQEAIYEKVEQVFHETAFASWKETSLKEFIQEKRAEEKKNKKYPKPYLDYVEEIEKKFFKEFWQKYHLDLLVEFIEKESSSYQKKAILKPYHEAIKPLQKEYSDSLEMLRKHFTALDPSLTKEYLGTMRSFKELTEPLYGKYRQLKNRQGGQKLKDLAAGFYPKYGHGYGKSYAYSQSTPLGSVFKLIVSYQALVERYKKLKENHESLADLNPLVLIDDMKGNKKMTSGRQILGYTTGGETIYRLYKGGMLPRAHPGIGKIDVRGALENSSNIYFSILAGDYIADPENIVSASKSFGFGTRTGIELPGEIPGVLPNDLSYNRTGLYSFAIGQHTLVVTPLQTAKMIATLANRGLALQPKIVQVLAGKEPERQQELLFSRKNYPFREILSLVGIDFPLFTEAVDREQKSSVLYSRPEIKGEVFLPDEIRNMLFEGMNLVINGSKGTARPSSIRRELYPPFFVDNYVNLQHQLIAKTGTAEILYKHTLDAESPPEMVTQVGFAGMSFPETPNNIWENPELVVVVYLRFGQSGKEGAPLAAQIVRKWREICKKHGQASYVLPPKKPVS